MASFITASICNHRCFTLNLKQSFQTTLTSQNRSLVSMNLPTMKMFISSRIIRILREIIIFQIFTLEAHCSKDKISIWSAVAFSFFWFHRYGNERFIKNTDIEYFFEPLWCLTLSKIVSSQTEILWDNVLLLVKKKTLWSEHCYERNDTKYIRKAYFYWIQVRSSPCLVSPGSFVQTVGYL